MSPTENCGAVATRARGEGGGQPHGAQAQGAEDAQPATEKNLMYTSGSP